MPKIIPSPLYRTEFEHDACGVGFIAKLNGERSYDVVNRAVSALKALAHRGAIDADAVTGDGAGILTQVPVDLFRAHLEENDLQLFANEDLGVGMIFLPVDNDYAQAHCMKLVEEAIEAEDLAWLAWRDVPTDDTCLGRKAIETQPRIVQALVARKGDIDAEEF